MENAVGPRDLYRMTRALLDLFLNSYEQDPTAILLDIDDTNDTTHGDQQLALFNAHYGDYGYQPLHIYEGQSGKLITTILRPGQRPTRETDCHDLKALNPSHSSPLAQGPNLTSRRFHFSAPEVHEFCETQKEPVILSPGAKWQCRVKGQGNPSHLTGSAAIPLATIPRHPSS